MQTYTIPANLLQAIISYLTGRPWNEVNGLLIELGRLTQEQEQANARKDTPT